MFLKILTLLSVVAWLAPASAEEKSQSIQTLIPWLLEEAGSFKDVRFADVIAATSGKRVLPIEREQADDQRVLAQIGAALDEVLVELNAPTSKTRKATRVNEMSSAFEDSIRAKLNARPELACTLPLTTAGLKQRSGYPDLRLLDKPTGRVFYLDPKLFAKGSRTSSFRTFYFEPKRATNKVNDDAHHLIIGIEHDRDAAGVVRFVRWELIDLAEFRVRLKAEFEGSNADLYRPEAVVGRSGESDR